MPLVARRSPASEKAAIYGYGDLLRDSLAFVRKKAAANVERMTSGRMGEEEILETALAPAGGMLKVAGTSKLLAGLLASQQKALAVKRISEVGRHPVYSPFKGQSEREVAEYFSPIQRVFREALKVPEKEYGRIKDIGWSSMAGQRVGTRGLYDPPTKTIKLHSALEDLETIWHEFTHARQFNPERLAKMPSGRKTEQGAAYTLAELHSALTEAASAVGMSEEQFYRTVSPIERHARGVAKAVVKFPRDFSTLYKYGLENELEIARKNMKKFLGEQ